MVNRAAVLGKPVAHSLSPVLHQAAYAELGLTDWTYERFEVGQGELASFVGERDETWRGFSVTMPAKEDAYALATTRAPVAERTGAVNTLVRTPGGWAGDNTDVYGVQQALLDAGFDPATLQDGVPVILGSGATARSALAALTDLGATRAAFVVRDQVRPATQAQAAADGVTLCGVDVAAAPVVINTVPGDAADSYATSWDSPVRSGQVVLDVRYAADRTPLGSAVTAAGAHLVGGIEMLVHQAAAQVVLMTGHDAPVAVMQAAGRAAMAAR
ncbi:shikimate dehydrogenase [Branchiibius hedensis]|uniref:Shikimate dehydrogenase n=1 Tax=Branchiibius hedensis TaxID=672460 RepID=A0A2Y8ZP86_9MICO|nr:shikimate dehydrogenase [Branchiibius hedensis]PWJ25357.1 shikimate dehydrogenase [Branchiibius hedensis]SSA34171.1 shikimate dehydrogenase [Branchiibius hedensis]